MNPVISLAKNDISPDVVRFAREMRKSLKVAVRQTARGITRRVIAITPPGTGEAAGRAAYQTGAAKIKRQMSSVFTPVRLKGRRKITHVFGRLLKRPIYVPTKERHPDVRGLYTARLHAGRTGLGFRTGRGAPLVVDVRKFDAELKRRSASIGKLAAGWLPAATALDVPVQQWISRHGGAGRGRFTPVADTYGDHLRITVENLAPGVPAHVTSELSRRISYAVQYERNSMQRQIVAYGQRLRRKGALAEAA